MMDVETPLVDGRADATTVDLPDLPAGWTAPTQTATHIGLFHVAGDGQETETGYRRSIGITKTPDAAPNRWTVSGLAGYGHPPRLAEGVPFGEALAVAVDEMEAVSHADREPTKGTPGKQGSGEADSSAQATASTAEGSSGRADGAGDDTPAQASLTDEWGAE